MIKPILNVLHPNGEGTYEVYPVLTNETMGVIERKIYSENNGKNMSIYYKGLFRDKETQKKIEGLGVDLTTTHFAINTDGILIFKVCKKEEIKVPVKKEEIKVPRENKAWTEEEDALLFQASREDVAKVLNRTVSAVAKRMSTLSLKKPDYFKKIQSMAGKIDLGIHKSTDTTEIKEFSAYQNKPHKIFTPEEDLISFIYKPKIAAIKLNRTSVSIGARRNNIKTKDPKYYEELVKKASKLKPLSEIKNHALFQAKILNENTKEYGEINLQEIAGLMSIEVPEEIIEEKVFIKEEPKIISETTKKEFLNQPIPQTIVKPKESFITESIDFEIKIKGLTLIFKNIIPKISIEEGNIIIIS